MFLNKKGHVQKKKGMSIAETATQGTMASAGIQQSE
jgi:hypothetical protein